MNLVSPGRAGRRDAASSVAPICPAYERSLRPCLALVHRTRTTKIILRRALRPQCADDRLRAAGLRVVVEGLAERDADEEDEHKQEQQGQPGGDERPPPAAAGAHRARPGGGHGSKSSAPRA